MQKVAIVESVARKVQAKRLATIWTDLVDVVVVLDRLAERVVVLRLDVQRVERLVHLEIEKTPGESIHLQSWSETSVNGLLEKL